MKDNSAKKISGQCRQCCERILEEYDLEDRIFVARILFLIIYSYCADKKYREIIEFNLSSSKHLEELYFMWFKERNRKVESALESLQAQLLRSLESLLQKSINVLLAEAAMETGMAVSVHEVNLSSVKREKKTSYRRFKTEIVGQGFANIAANYLLIAAERLSKKKAKKVIYDDLANVTRVTLKEVLNLRDREIPGFIHSAPMFRNIVNKAKKLREKEAEEFGIAEPFATDLISKHSQKLGFK